MIVFILTLWNAALLALGEMLLVRIFRTLFPLTNADRLEQWRTPLSRKEFWIRISVFTVLFLGGNLGCIVLVVLRG